MRTIIDFIGHTPLVPLLRLSSHAIIFGKCECFNPGGSVKDRVAHSMIIDGEKKGLLKKDGVIVEPTSGNTGIGLAWIAAVKGYSIILTMPESMSIERRKLLASYGAELVLTPANQGMRGAVEKAEELCARIENAYMPQQFKNPANPLIHRETTAEEIWQVVPDLDVFVAGVGTGGTITGVGEVLKSRNSKISVVAVEPLASPVLSGGTPGPHIIQGIGAGFVPEIFNRDIVDEIIQVSDESAIETQQLISRKEGIFVGISSGAAVWAAQKISERLENKGKKIVVILPDTGERYISMASIFAK